MIFEKFDENPFQASYPHAISNFQNYLKYINNLIKIQAAQNRLNKSLTNKKAKLKKRDRPVTMATYLLSGFANMASVGLQIACLSSLAPNRTKLLWGCEVHFNSIE
ncbi:hypothetical protein BpHYR1_019382 [Brachionus plicatilis]|uniref:Concentrative nucleoside transporter C-terminal domain-containing protein n=1 Tax=Brachionus plicatilis TaxID=10195 RepID=A0A3M7PUK2_BRAPC|nr:hypothetical protein BpHYR1_019382 [Brachionus plicatilis]